MCLHTQIHLNLYWVQCICFPLPQQTFLNVSRISQFFISPVSPFKHTLQISLIITAPETELMFPVILYSKHIVCV